MLKDYMKPGDTIHKKGIIELIDIIDKNLAVWSITTYMRKDLEFQKKELVNVLEYMNKNNLDTMEYQEIMLNDYLNSGDIVNRNSIPNLIDDIEQKLEIGMFSLSVSEKEKLKKIQDELTTILAYMKRHKLDTIEYQPGKIKPPYKCSKCGKLFNHPSYVKSCVGEAWGLPWMQDEDVSPCCHAYYENIEDYPEE